MSATEFRHGFSVYPETSQLCSLCLTFLMCDKRRILTYLPKM